MDIHQDLIRFLLSFLLGIPIFYEDTIPLLKVYQVILTQCHAHLMRGLDYVSKRISLIPNLIKERNANRSPI